MISVAAILLFSFELFFMGSNIREDLIILDLNLKPFDQPHVSEAKLAKAKLVELGARI